MKLQEGIERSKDTVKDEDSPPVCGNDAKWWILSHSAGVMRKPADIMGVLRGIGANYLRPTDITCSRNYPPLLHVRLPSRISQDSRTITIPVNALRANLNTVFATHHLHPLTHPPPRTPRVRSAPRQKHCPDRSRTHERFQCVMSTFPKQQYLPVPQKTWALLAFAFHVLPLSPLPVPIAFSV